MSAPSCEPWILARARVDPDRDALLFGDARLSWRQLAEAALAEAAELSARGVVRGDIVAVQMVPQPRMVALLHAVQMLGAAMLPLNLRLTPAETTRILDHAAPRVVLADEGKSTAVAARKSFATPSRVDAASTLTIVYTSGTTAAPKGVVLTNANYEAGATASQRRLGHGEADTWLATLPLFHVGGLAILARSVLEGSRTILETGFDTDRAVSVIEGGEASMVSLVPTMLARVLDRMNAAPSPRLRAVLVGGAALAPALGRRALAAGLPVSATWGMTEACSQICSSEPGSDAAARGLVGRPLDGNDVRVADADADGWGELLVRGPTIMRGYLRNDEADAVALAGGWLHSGDIGRIDEAGAVAVFGRRGDLIVSGGENISPVEVEQVLDEHPDVVESLVSAADDAEWGQRVVASVVLTERGAADAEALTAWCRPRIAAYKVPREFRFVDALARGATGKLLRR